ncbi:Arachidonate--CoA ligase [Aphelenchoides fujianensis]|nr:Arachidonate--CoA ligase [Aphelenchoides fujianensis]
MSVWPLSLIEEESGGLLTSAIVAAAIGCFFFTSLASIKRSRLKTRRAPSRADCLVDTPKEFLANLDGVQTLYQLFLRGLEKSENNKCLGYRAAKDQPYQWLNYAEIFRRSQNIGSAFLSVLGVQPGNQTHIGIYSRNCPEWFISSLACLRFSMVTVPLYDTLGADAATFIVQQTEMQAIVVDELDKVEKLLTNAAQTPTLKHIVLINHSKLTHALIEQAETAGIRLHKFRDLLTAGEREYHADVEPKASDLYIICYTSGTTGTPERMIHIIRSFTPGMDNPNQVSISYLPLSHMFEQVVHWSMLFLGGSIGYFMGDVRTLTDDMKELKPTIFPTVPRLLNRFPRLDSKSDGQAESLAIVKRGIVQRDSFWDRLVVKKFQEQVGGNVQLVVTGSAPISAEVLDACRVAFGAHVLEGYGQTECCAMATLTWPFETRPGHCGGPASCTKLKLEDVPELNYFVKDRKGEVLIKGPSVTRGYFNDPEKTRELFDSNGYLHTGDIGHILPDGTLQIIDRKKHIFKLAQGEYVAPEKIENVYVKCPLVQQVYVDGDSLENFLVAVIVPEAHALIKWHKANGGGEESLEEICRSKKARESPSNK